MRGRYEEIRGFGGELVAIGTGDVAMARDFVATDGIPFPVLVDDGAAAARAAAVERVGPLRLFSPRSYAGTVRAWKSGHRTEPV